MSRLAVSLIVLGALAPVFAAGLAQDRPATAAGRLLEIDAVPLDRNGNVLSDISRDEVEVWIERHRIPIETFIAITPGDERARRSIVLLLDDITVSPSNTARVRDVAGRFVDQLGPGDQMAVIGLNGDASRSTDDRAALRRSINAYNVGATAPMRPDELSAHVLTALTSISRQVTESPARRRTVVAIGTGWLFDTPIPPPSIGRDVRKEWTEAIRAMALANVTLYVIDPGGVGSSRVSGGENGFARETGGHAFTNTNDMDRAVQRIMREAVSYYILRFQDPPMFRKEILREVEVRILRPGAKIRAPRYLPGPG
jgi:VWFA-related protein